MTIAPRFAPIFAYLNDLLEVDREGITRLVNARVPCNERLAGDRYVTVLTGADGVSTVGLLGVINGLFTRTDDMLVATYDNATGLIAEFNWISKDDGGPSTWTAKNGGAR